MRDVLGVKMSNELVSIGFHFFDVGIEFWLGEIDSFQQATEKCGLICNDLSPVVLSAFITKKFAPLQDADVEKVAVSIRPELALKYGLPSPPSCLIEGEISEEVATENCNPSE